ncbi:MAG: superfamily II DNA or RNA helicase [Candidatus Azotimanducaceae bacterium]
MSALINSILSHDDIRDACGSSSFTRGENYYFQGHVLSLKLEDPDNNTDSIGLMAYTSGSNGHKYKQSITLTAYDRVIDIDGDCSCPMDYNCKHVAAVCLKFLDEAKPVKQGASSDAQREEVRLNDWLDKLSNAVSQEFISPPPEHRDYLVYLLKPRDAPGDSSKGVKRMRLWVEVIATHARKNGRGFVKGRTVSIGSLDYAPTAIQWDVQPIDNEINQFLKGLSQAMYRFNETELRGRAGGLALMGMLQTGRCYCRDLDGFPLVSAAPRKLDIIWQQKNNDADYSLQLTLQKSAQLLTIEPPMYLDETSCEIGFIECAELSGAMLEVIINAPAVPQKQAAQFSRQLRQQFPQLELPTPVEVVVRNNNGEQLLPWLTLSQNSDNSRQFHTLSMMFDYGGDAIMPTPIEEVTVFSSDTEIVHIQRNLLAEAEAVQRLMDFGFSPLDSNSAKASPLELLANAESLLDSAAVWADFLEKEVELLRADGWRIDISDNFALEFIDGDWAPSIKDLDGDDGGNDWFELRFDLEVDGHKLPLAPLLVPILHEDPDTLPDTITLPLDDGHRYLRLPSERIRPFLTTLRELFDRSPPDDNGNIRISRFDAMLVDDLGGQQKQIKGAQKLRKLAEKLRDFNGIKAVKVPKGFGAELRNYQQAGLNWLQFLREYQFNGVLADDMGLGKTVQTLAHLLVEKRSGRLKQPALIIAPTSLMGNWRREAEHFAPQLRVLTLHGDDRHARFGEIESNDLVLTTYPLLVRDTDILLAQHYHYVVLDEAQAIKNPATKMAKTVRNLKSNHRLCLTGTPLENHLGEIWSLFDFLMPGFLGNLQTFNRCYRVPIEKQGNVERSNGLAKRIQPFLLRREKSEVASELPPKTEIVHHVELSKEQAQLYESIRVAMDKRVRDAIKQQGLSRSHITILDALLKLRQVCCDPRLVKLERAKKVKCSAKLEWLMEMLPKQLEEGRRILLFSQFTSMLSLIETELKQRGIDYSKLTGQTRKRDDAIQRFREGEVSVFLISLKAGGTGLNLVEADTVIIYDPWWNPAVEAQAIDRAHRIGQDKPVFIYKLVTSNSVEEKMLAMQDKKRALARGIYSKNSNEGTALLNEDSLKELFAPLS